LNEAKWQMNRIHIVGRKNHGKTTLIVELVREYTRQGIRVGTIKHSCHVHELDTPGKDSHRHRAAGGQPAAILTREAVGVFWSHSGDCEYERLEPLFADCQLVLVEGDIDAAGIKIEVWRALPGSSCLALGRPDIAAVVSDDRPPVTIPVWARGSVPRLAEQIWELAPSQGIASPGQGGAGPDGATPRGPRSGRSSG
jgi:molybdopterin-guanine dinucleotide biosynthesis protein B